MAFMKFKGYDIFYETFGEGKPLIILNGIMMSTKSWGQIIDPLSSFRKLVLVDMIDQGQSSDGPSEYNHDLQVEVIKALIDHLELATADVFGISYGGQIAMQLALKYPKSIDKLLLFNTSAASGQWLTEIGNAWILASDNWESYYATAIPIIYSPIFYNENIEWMNQRKKDLEPVFSDKRFISRMNRLTLSSTDYDIRDKVSSIKHKTLIVGSEYDFITPFNEQEYMHQKIDGSDLVLIPNAGHASMYEKPSIFLSLIIGYILI